MTKMFRYHISFLSIFRRKTGNIIISKYNYMNVSLFYQHRFSNNSLSMTFWGEHLKLHYKYNMAGENTAISVSLLGIMFAWIDSKTLEVKVLTTGLAFKFLCLEVKRCFPIVALFKFQERAKGSPAWQVTTPSHSRARDVSRI